MTDKIQQARRAAFESQMEALNKSPGEWRGNHYSNPYGNSAWQGFNAALDCVEIMIMPKAVAEQFSGEFVAADCRLAINVQGLGLRVK